MFFCHSLARTCLLATRVARYGSAFHRVPSVVGPLGYAQPEQPIHVVLARDEEIAIENRVSSEMKVVAPPPAYGLWRSSVVCFRSFRDIPFLNMEMSSHSLSTASISNEHVSENQPELDILATSPAEYVERKRC